MHGGTGERLKSVNVWVVGMVEHAGCRDDHVSCLTPAGVGHEVPATVGEHAVQHLLTESDRGHHIEVRGDPFEVGLDLGAR